MPFTSSYINVKTNFRGTHNWENCPLKEVGFLAEPHRHVFYVDLTVPVGHDDRQLEFFIIQDFMDDAIRSLYGCPESLVYKLDSRSCEMIAKEIIGEIRGYTGLNDLDWIRCFVSEDNENGAGVVWEKDR